MNEMMLNRKTKLLFKKIIIFTFFFDFIKELDFTSTIFIIIILFF